MARADSLGAGSGERDGDRLGSGGQKFFYGDAG